MATFRKVWQCREVAAPSATLVGQQFPIRGEDGADIGTGNVVAVGSDTITIDLVIPESLLAAFEAVGDVRAIAVDLDIRKEPAVIMKLTEAQLAKSSSYIEPEDKQRPYEPARRTG